MKKNGRRGGNPTRNSYTAGGGILEWQTEAAENSGSRAKKMSSKGLDLTGDGPLVPNCRIEARQTKGRPWRPPQTHPTRFTTLEIENHGRLSQEQETASEP
jgi:hypothetical protein